MVYLHLHNNTQQVELKDIQVQITVTAEDEAAPQSEVPPPAEEVKSKSQSAKKDKVSTVDDLKQEIQMVIYYMHNVFFFLHISPHLLVGLSGPYPASSIYSFVREVVHTLFTAC